MTLLGEQQENQYKQSHPCLLEREARNKNALPGQEVRGGAECCDSRGDDLPEACTDVAVGQRRSCCLFEIRQRSSRWIAPIRTVQDVCEFHADVQGLLRVTAANLEDSADV